ncbi:MAG: sigma-54 dependent transcriptional regulator [Planctomycetota bacterium]
MQSPPRILIADQDQLAVETLGRWLEEARYLPHQAASGASALEMLDRHDFDLLIVEQRLEDMDGIALVGRVRAERPSLPVLMMTAYGTIEDAVEAMREGVFDYLSKPVVQDELLLAIQRALEQAALVQENASLRTQLDRRRRLDGLVGPSERMAGILEVVDSVAPTRATVLILGESGTGKTLLARTIHEHSDRRGGPFVEVNCGALPDSLLESELFGHARGAFTGAVKDKPGKFEDADGGTVFLDEVATASPALQVKLLRVLQDRIFERVGETRTREVDVRLVLATNRDLMKLVHEGSFREDLFYRINVVSIELPPLRERIEDVPFLIEHFLASFAEYHGKRVVGVAPEALDAMLAHDWPGNIRELENAVERSVVLARGDLVELGDLPTALRGRDRPLVELRDQVLPLKLALEEPERLIIQRALELNGWNRQQTADMLEINRTTLFHKMRKYGLMPRKARKADRP